MRIKTFLEYINKNQIPPDPPDFCVPGGYGINHPWLRDFDDGLKGRQIATDAGMWAIVARSWTDLLADWIGNRRVLEVMSGRGWLAKALLDAGVNIVATDDYSWMTKNGKNKYDLLIDVENLTATEAITKFQDADLLLICWPPYDTPDAASALKAWEPDWPVIYIGEGPGGCNGDNEFHDLFVPDTNQPDILVPSWPGIHDYLVIGKRNN